MKRTQRKLTKTERAEERAWSRAFRARRHGLRAEEPLLAERDAAFADLNKVQRAAQRLVSGHAIAIIGLISNYACDTQGCRCVWCRARELSMQLDDVRASFKRLDAVPREAVKEAEERVWNKLRAANAADRNNTEVRDD